LAAFGCHASFPLRGGLLGRWGRFPST
jgi:hypothetical protein